MKKENQKATVSYMTVGKLFYGSSKSSNDKQNSLLVKTFLAIVEILDIMEMFGNLKFELQKKWQNVAEC